MGDKVSIIMNCYNGEEYLREAINSVIAQTYENWELIFWDNRSTDNSAQIFQEFKDIRFRYFLAPSHTLLYEARSMAMQKVSGEYIAFGGHLNTVHFETELAYFNRFAKLYNKKVHVLGSWREIVLEKGQFYSADSSAWIKRALYGELIGLTINKKTGGVKIKTVEKVDKSTHRNECIRHNLQEMMRAQKILLELVDNKK